MTPFLTEENLHWKEKAHEVAEKIVRPLAAKYDELEEYPWETIGEAMVVEAHEETCLAVVTRSVRELEIGMRVKMIKGY